MKSKSLNIQRPFIDTSTASPHKQRDCFRLKDKINEPLQQGELLADVNYILCLNSNGTAIERTGKRLIFFFNSIFGTTFIPWVLARCTIIRL